MKRKRIAEIRTMLERVGELLSHAPNDSREYHTLFGANRALEWVLGMDEHMAGPTFGEFLATKRVFDA